jgi:hypothetical protein
MCLASGGRNKYCPLTTHMKQKGLFGFNSYLMMIAKMLRLRGKEYEII